MPSSNHSPFRVSATAYFWLYGLLLSAFFRFIWTFSLANGDEFFFASLRGAATPGNYSLKELGDFLYFLWAEHTGRTADWLSTLIFYFGFDAGLWLTSALTGGSATLFAFAVFRFLRIAQPGFATKQLVFQSLLAATFALFAPAVTKVAYVSNLLVYSAAICNYLVFASLLVLAWSLVFTSVSQRAWVGASLLAFLVASSHEQAAVAVVTLAGLLWFTRLQAVGAPKLLGFTVASLLGAAAMFASPGLHHKLGRASVDTSLSAGLLLKAKTSLLAFGSQYHWLLAFLFCIGVWGLITLQEVKAGRSQRNSAKKPRTSAFAALLVLALVAVSTLSIPLASGVGQTRVFHYPLLLGGLAAVTAYQLGFQLQRPGKKKSQNRWQLFAHKLGTLGLVLIVVGGIIVTFWSQYANYPAGRVQLEAQIEACESGRCQLTDPTGLPVHHGFSGYGDHDYANTQYMEMWLRLQ